MDRQAYTCLRFFIFSRTVAFFLLILSSLWLFLPETGWAARFNIPSEQVNELARHPGWLKLLHFVDDQSEVLTDDFFLAPDGRHDPAAELLATLNAYSEPWPATHDDSHARCRFPARYLWLSNHISLPDYSPQPSQCIKLSKWSLPDQLRSISLFLVSGYLGNPASVFGHSLLKFNTDSTDDQAGLFDLTVNYGALIPENESVLRYIAYGLTGGYQAGFSDRYFYTQDLVYSRTEFRDIWDYELSLPPEQQQLLVLHLWEILGKKFTYYFFDKNCAFRLAELLELILDEPLLEHAQLWYAPVETFHRLEEIDRLRKESGKAGLIQSVHFIPSAERTLYHRFDQLEDGGKKAIQTVIREGTDSLQNALKQVNTSRKPEVLDTLLAYFNYKLIEEAPTPHEDLLQGKKDLLLARLHLPSRTMPLEEVPERDSPAQGNPPLLTGLGLGHTQVRNSYLRLHLAPFSQESIGRNSLEGDELTVLDTALGISNEELFIDRFDLVRIRKLKTNSALAEGLEAWSWQLRTGMESVEEEGDAEQDLFFRFGAGQARKFANTMVGYALLEGSSHTEQPHLRLFPHLGLLTTFAHSRARIYAGPSLSYEEDPEFLYGIEFQQDISTRSALAVDVRKDTIAIELKWYW